MLLQVKIELALVDQSVLLDDLRLGAAVPDHLACPALGVAFLGGATLDLALDTLGDHTMPC